MSGFRDFVERRYAEAEEYSCGVSEPQQDIAADAWNTAIATAIQSISETIGSNPTSGQLAAVLDAQKTYHLQF